MPGRCMPGNRGQTTFSFAHAETGDRPRFLCACDDFWAAHTDRASRMGPALHKNVVCPLFPLFSARACPKRLGATMHLGVGGELKTMARIDVGQRPRRRLVQPRRGALRKLARRLGARLGGRAGRRSVGALRLRIGRHSGQCQGGEQTDPCHKRGLAGIRAIESHHFAKVSASRLDCNARPSVRTGETAN